MRSRSSGGAKKSRRALKVLVREAGHQGLEAAERSEVRDFGREIERLRGEVLVQERLERIRSYAGVAPPPLTLVGSSCFWRRGVRDGDGVAESAGLNPVDDD